MELIRELKPKGIIVIPKDIREQAKMKERDKLAISVRGDEIIIKKQQDGNAWLKDFLKYRKKGREITLKELKKIEDESYDLP